MELKMNKLKKRPLVLSFLVGFLLLYCSIVSAEINSSIDKNQDILKLLEVSGLLDQMSYIKEGVNKTYARVISLTYPKVPDQFWDDFNKLVGKEEMKVLLVN